MDVISLSKAGYINGSLSTSQSLASVVSAFIIGSPTSTSTSTSTVGSKRYLGTSSSATVYPVTVAVDGLIQGVQLGMASGESPVSLVSSNVQITVSSTLIAEDSNSFFSTPATASQQAYGTIAPKITLGPNGVSSCNFPGGYSHMSVLQWATNPYPYSTDVKTTLFRISAASEEAGSATRINASVSHVDGLPAYTVALQFSIVHHNLTITDSSLAVRRSKSNYSIPVCTLYNGVAYVPCKGCNVSSYTDYNVTYSCFDITQICPTAAITSPSGTKINIPQSATNLSVSATSTLSAGTSLSRNAASTDRLYPQDRGWMGGGRLFGAEEEQLIDKDTRISQFAASISDATEAPAYGALITSIKQEIIDVLTSNPFKLNLKASTSVLSFVGVLGGIILVSLVYLLRLDYNEKLFKTYVKKDADELMRKLEVNIKRGENGIIEVRWLL